jgi:uncharacterized protein YcbX
MSANKLIVTDLFIYPIKSLGGIRVEASLIQERGLLHDRSWVLIDENNRFITQRENSQLVFFSTEINDSYLKVFDKRDPSDYILVDLFPQFGELVSVQIWDDICDSILVSDDASNWFSAKLDMNLRLAFMPDLTKRLVDTKYAKEDEITGFSDGYPILMIGTASLEDLNSRLAQPIGMDRFRPNIVFSGGEPFEEDLIKDFTINGVMMRGVKPCARCIMTTTNQVTAERSKEPLNTLSTYRKKDNKIYFGQNVLAKGLGSINVGDLIFRM